MPGCDGAGMAERSYLSLRSGVAAKRSCGREELPHVPTPEVRDGDWEEQPHIQGAVAARAQEGLEELSHVEGQEGRG